MSLSYKHSNNKLEIKHRLTHRMIMALISCLVFFLMGYFLFRLMPHLQNFDPLNICALRAILFLIIYAIFGFSAIIFVSSFFAEKVVITENRVCMYIGFIPVKKVSFSQITYGPFKQINYSPIAPGSKSEPSYHVFMRYTNAEKSKKTILFNSLKSEEADKVVEEIANFRSKIEGCSMS